MDVRGGCGIESPALRAPPLSRRDVATRPPTVVRVERLMFGTHRTALVAALAPAAELAHAVEFDRVRRVAEGVVAYGDVALDGRVEQAIEFDVVGAVGECQYVLTRVLRVFAGVVVVRVVVEG